MREVVTATEVVKIILNRYPICYIGYMDEIILSEKIIATRNVTTNEEFFQGHFPGNPTMPGALIIEALIQVGLVLILKMNQFEGKTACIGGINKARFRQEVVLGDVLKLHFEIVELHDFVSTGRATAYVEDKKVCEYELTSIVGR